MVCIEVEVLVGCDEGAAALQQLEISGTQSLGRCVPPRLGWSLWFVLDGANPCDIGTVATR